MSDREKWDRRYREAAADDVRAALVLRANTHLLPAAGRALDLACGLGGNARLMAASGLDAEGWDVSQVAIDKLNVYARERGLALNGVCRDVEIEPPLPASFDVIVVSRFLSRTLAEDLIEALRPGGLLFYQTFTREHVDPVGPRNDEYRLAPNELLKLFYSLRTLVYREEGRIGDVRQGWRNEAMLVACRERTE